MIALRLGERLGISAAERRVVYYSGLLAWVGCHTDAYEQAKWFGDDLSVKSDVHYGYDLGRAGPAAAFLAKHVGGAGAPLLQRARVGLAFMGDGRRAMLRWRRITTWPRTSSPPDSDSVSACGPACKQTYERWDGKGAFRMRGEQIPLASRLINLADVVEVFRRTGGVDAAVAVARERSGTQFDPDLVDLFCRAGAADLRRRRRSGELGPGDRSRSRSLARVITEAELDDALAAIAEFADSKSPWTIGHSAGGGRPGRGGGAGPTGWRRPR